MTDKINYNMTDKDKFNIIYKYFAKPIAAMKMTYNNSAMTIEAGVVNPKVSKCFQTLMDALNEQLDNYRHIGLVETTRIKFK